MKTTEQALTNNSRQENNCSALKNIKSLKKPGKLKILIKKVKNNIEPN